jgi:hypothetical protein
VETEEEREARFNYEPPAILPVDGMDYSEQNKNAYADYVRRRDADSDSGSNTA